MIVVLLLLLILLILSTIQSIEPIESIGPIESIETIQSIEVIEQYKTNVVTVVTCFYVVPNNNHYSLDMFLSWIENFMQVVTHAVIFVDDISHKVSSSSLS